MGSESMPAVAAADLTIRELATPAEFEAGDRLQRRVWGIGKGSTPVPAEVLNAISHSGGYVAGALEDGRLVGIAAALIGFQSDARHVFLWAHILAAENRDTGIGHALMVDQRSWCRARGIDSARWTFDPLVSRNAYFYLTKLGVDVLTYVPDFYGPLDDGVNLGDESDRLLVAWPLTPCHDQERIGCAKDPEHGPREWRPLLSIDARGRPQVHPRGNDVQVTCAVPADIEALRRQDPALARSWRHALRECLSGVLDGGGRIIGFTRLGQYLLTTGDA
ncbi:GNAT family N-acetyltransferase [Streptomyces sp900105755]|uniref:GNAT family N-acetyltransferase n=1 Tax=Streptomyces sp. 900105755 TaxID=3154389 RepID=UPI003324C48C